MSAGARSPTAGTRERLLAAAREVVEEGGYRAASVLAIAERANVAAGTLYRHFASKEELFVELFRDVSGREIRAMRHALETLGKGGSAIDRLETVLATFAERALRNPRLAWALMAEPVDPLVDAERLLYRARHSEMCTALVREAIERGQIPAQDAEFTAAALVGGVGEALIGPLSPLADPPRRDPATMVAALQTFARRAVGAEPRRAPSPAAS